ERFLTEARTIAELKHSSIVRVYYCNVERNIPFLVMDYAPNGTLRQYHPMGTKVPLATVVTYTNQLANALSYIHKKGFVHRDVKPENVLVDRDGSLLLSDFGIVTVSQSFRGTQQSNQEGIGSPYYMAPEQILGKPSRASDQYA